MESFKIIGGNTLNGTVVIKGAKNAVLPLMACALLTDDEVVLHNVPHLTDIETMSDVLRHLGATVVHENETIRIRANNITKFDAPYDLVSKMRAAFWVLGPLLGRFHQADISMPGGCAIGARAIDRHLYAMERLGATIDLDKGYVEARSSGRLKGNQIGFQILTVGGTMNALMAAVMASGTTEIINAACEPEVTDLARCLEKMGAKIGGIGTRRLTIEGVDTLHGTEYSVMTDRIEAATYAVAAGMTHGELMIENGHLHFMEEVAFTLIRMGLKVIDKKNGLWVSGKDCDIVATDVTTEEYPGFPTDVQAQVMALMCLAKGTSTVRETIFENRFMHVPELGRMGANIKLQSGNTAIVRGVDQLQGAPVMASDLRASAALVLAGLAAQGETIVNRIYHLDRGYDHMEEKLRAVGANIERIRTPEEYR